MTRNEQVKDLLARGFKLFPCWPNKKTPAIERWKKFAATATYEDLKDFIENGYNIAIVPSLSGHLVIDVDKDKDGYASLASLEQREGKLPATFTVRTRGGGEHRYYVGTCRPNSGRLGAGIDVRSEDSYVLCPPSQIEGKKYEVLEDRPFQECPAKIFAKLVEKNQAAQIKTIGATELDTDAQIDRATEYLLGAQPCVEDGEFGGGIGLYQIACQVRDIGISQSVCEELIREHYNDRCDPPWDMDTDYDQKHFTTKIANAYNYAQNAAGSKSPEIVAAEAMASLGGIEPHKPVPQDRKLDRSIVKNFDRDFSNLPKRDWAVGGMFLSRFMSVLGGAGGTGKTNLEYLRFAAIVTGRNLLGESFPIIRKGPVLLFNAEDPFSEMELRIAALSKVFDIPRTQLAQLYGLSGRDFPLVYVSSDRFGAPRINEKLVEEVIEMCLDLKLVGVSFDPLVHMHRSQENNTEAGSMLMDCFARIGEKANLFISLLHHLRKFSSKSEDSDDQNLFRGSSSYLAACRVAHIVTPMQAAEAKKMGISEDHRFRYLKLESAKANLTPRMGGAAWFEMVSETVGQGESIGVCKLSPIKQIEEIKKAEKALTALGDAKQFLLATLFVGDEMDLGELQAKAAICGYTRHDSNLSRFREHLLKAVKLHDKDFKLVDGVRGRIAIKRLETSEESVLD